MRLCFHYCAALDLYSKLLFRRKISRNEWFGTLIAIAGFVYLVQPELTSATLSGFILIALAGIAWAAYTVFAVSQQIH